MIRNHDQDTSGFHPIRRGIRSGLASGFCLWTCLAATGCVSGAASKDPPPVFGGQGARVTDPAEIPLSQAGEPSAAEAGPCGKPAPPSETSLLDDFEDNDNKPFKGFQREGWWYVATDETPDGKVVPPKGTFTAEKLSEGEASLDNQYAAHFSAEGFKDWGVVWGTTLKWVNDGIKCPLNASAFSGLRFRAKGQGVIAIKIGTPETIPTKDGGKCEKKCYDSYSKIVRLTESWQTHTIPFNRLQQGGWGTEARFDPQRLLSLNFSADPKTQPVDFWVDDIEFIPATASAAAPASAPPPGATPAATPAMAPPSPSTPKPATLKAAPAAPPTPAPAAPLPSQ